MSTGKMLGKVWLVGAGPGAADLLTVRAVRVLGQATAVVYDELAARELQAELAPATALRYYVGKRSGHHTLPQEEIHHLLLRLAHQGHTVVRLKGGDPLIFGRGGEESDFLRAHGIEVEIVPGVTAALAAGAAAHIPLTHRQAAPAVTFVTGHECSAKSGPAVDWAALWRSGSTLCVYMGVSALPGIAEKLLAAGAPADWPVAIVARASQPTQQVVRTTLALAAYTARTEQIAAPALLIIGAVAAHGLSEAELAAAVAVGGRGAAE